MGRIAVPVLPPSKKAEVPKSEQEWLEASNQVAHNVCNLIERISNRFTLQDPKLIKRYLAAQLGVVLILRYRKSEHCAFFQRHKVEELRDKSRDSIFAPGCCTCEHGRHAGNQQAVFVDVVECMELPERFIPSLVWFERSDLVDDILPHSEYFSGSVRFVFRDTLCNRKRSSSGRCPARGKYKLSRQVVERRSKVLQCVPDQDGDADRDVTHVSDVIGALSSLRIVLGVSLARVRWAVESVRRDFQIIDMLFGSIDLWPNGVNSVGHEVVILREAKKYLPNKYARREPSLQQPRFAI